MTAPATTHGTGAQEELEPMTTNYHDLRVETHDDITVVTLANPPRNTLPLAVGRQLLDVAGDIRRSATRAVIVTGSGSYFCAGVDPGDLEVEGSAADMQRLSRRAHEMIGALAGAGRPLIAAINGLCTGAGLELALACHLRVASERARFAAPEVSMGFFPCAGGTQRLTRAIGRPRAYELMLTGDTIRAEVAARWGLVNRVTKHDECLPAAIRLARRIASKGAPAVACVLEAVERGGDLPLAEGLRLEADLMATLGDSADRREGFRAFIEERVPIFREPPPTHGTHPS